MYCSPFRCYSLFVSLVLLVFFVAFSDHCLLVPIYAFDVVCLVVLLAQLLFGDVIVLALLLLIALLLIVLALLLVLAFAQLLLCRFSFG